MPPYSSDDLVVLCGLSYSTLNHWCRVGWVAPSVAEGKGAGSARRWSFRDAVFVMCLSEIQRRLGRPSVDHRGMWEAIRKASIDEAIPEYSDEDLKVILSGGIPASEPVSWLGDPQYLVCSGPYTRGIVRASELHRELDGGPWAVVSIDEIVARLKRGTAVLRATKETER